MKQINNSPAKRKGNEGQGRQARWREKQEEEEARVGTRDRE